MKVLILTNSGGGLYRFRKELLERLVARNEQVFVSLPDTGNFGAELESLGVTVIQTPFNRRGINVLKDIALFCRYFSVIRKTKPNVVLTYTVKPNVYGNMAAALLKRPVISTVTGLGDTFLSKGLISRLVKRLYRTAFRKTACIAFENRENETIMRDARIINRQRVIHVPGAGVNLAEHCKSNYPQAEPVAFLYIGRFMRTKGVCELLNAARRLKQNYKFTLTLMGTSEGGIDREIETAEKDGVIINVGFQKDVDAFIQNAHCVVLPSYSEGMANALLEGAACGRPLIATDISGCREAVNNGVNGFLCKPADENSLYEAMKRFLECSHEQRRQMGAASRTLAEQRFDRDIVVNAVINEIYYLAQGLIGGAIV